MASREADALSLAFLPVITKAKDNRSQKEQHNGFHQCRNLDGVFSIESEVSKGAVLLIDDIVDSSWTLTTVAALLRSAGCSTVWPCALASVSSGN